MVGIVMSRAEEEGPWKFVFGQIRKVLCWRLDEGIRRGRIDTVVDG